MERLFKYFDFPSLLDQNGMRYGFRFSLNIQHPAQHIDVHTHSTYRFD